MEKAKHSEQETGTDPLTNGMSLRGAEDNNLFHFHAPIPKKKNMQKRWEGRPGVSSKTEAAGWV